MSGRTPLSRSWPAGLASLVSLERALQTSPLSAAITELVKVRVSQLNGCGFCIDMHTRAAVERGESMYRLAVLPAWSESTVFTGVERAALALADALSQAPPLEVPDDVWDRAEEKLGVAETGGLVLAVAVINLWNRIAIATRLEAHGLDATRTSGAGRAGPDDGTAARTGLLRAHLEAENAQDLNRLLATLTPDCMFTDVATGETWRGHGGATQFYEKWWSAFGNVVTAESLAFTAPDRAIAETTWRGAHVGQFDDVAATHRPVEVRVLIVVEFRDGLMAAETLYWDRAALLRDLSDACD